MHNFWAQNGLFSQMIFFFSRKPVNEPCFFHSYLSRCQKSTSDNNLFLEFWQIKNTEISLAKNILGYNLRTRFFPSMQSFCRMLMNHRNFCFTQIPDKTNDMIFLGSPKTLRILVTFAQWGLFPKILALSHITIYGPLKPC